MRFQKVLGHIVFQSKKKCANQNSLDSIYAQKIDLTNYFVAKSESNLFSKYGDNDLWKYVIMSVRLWNFKDAGS